MMVKISPSLPTHFQSEAQMVYHRCQELLLAEQMDRLPGVPRVDVH